MHQKAAQTQAQLRDQLVLLQTLQTLEAYQEFCYQLYLFFSTTYNPLNKVSTMQKAGTPSYKKVHFYYGAGNARYLKHVYGSDTYYLGKSYEEQITGNEGIGVR